MDAFELAKKLNGTFNANKVRAMVDGQMQVIARFEGPELILTDVGRRALHQADAEDVVVKEDAPRKKKAKAGLEPTPEAAPAVELPDVQLSDE